jgi:cytochrome c551/c552
MKATNGALHLVATSLDVSYSRRETSQSSKLAQAGHRAIKKHVLPHSQGCWQCHQEHMGLIN